MRKSILVTILALSACTPSQNYLGGKTVIPQPDLATTTGDGSIASAASCTSAKSIASMPAALSNHGAAAGADGLIYVMGGQTSEGSSSLHVYTYDVSAGTWSTTTDMPAATRGVPAVAAIGNIIYVVDEQLYAYDITSKAWSTKTARAQTYDNASAAAGPDGKLYVTGGIGTADESIGPAVVYDPASNAWSTLPTPPSGNDGQEATFIGDTFYVFGTNTLAFDLTTQKWAQLADPGTPIYWSAGGAIGKSLVLFGGYLPSKTGSTKTSEAFDLSTNSWGTRAAPPFSTATAAGALGCDGQFYVFGGDDGGNSTAIVQAYSADGDSWRSSQ